MTMETPPITPPPSTLPAAHVCPKCLREFIRLREARPHILGCKGRKKHLPPKLLAGSGCEIGFTEHYQDIALGEDGNVAMVTENRLHILSVPLNCRKKEVLSAVTVSCEYPKKEIIGEYSDMTAQEHWYTMGSNGVTGVKRVFWLPNLSDKTPHLLALHNNGSLVLYRQSTGSLQWEECGNYSKKVRMFVRANERPEEGLVSVFMTKELQIEGGEGKVELAEEAEQVTDNRAPYHTIDGHTMLNKYHTGPARVYNEKTNGAAAARTPAPKIGRPRKTPIKKEHATPSRVKQPSRDANVDPDADLVVPKRLIKQLTKTAKDGVSKRVVKIIDPTGENGDENEDNVNCPCGAREEDSSADEEWVECELCHVWQHMDCVGYYPEVQDYFHCEDCLKKNKEAEKKIKQEKGQEKRGRPKKLVPKKERVSTAYVSDSDSEVEVTKATPKSRAAKATLTPLQLLEQELDQTDSSEASSKKGAKTPTRGKGRAPKVPKLELAPSTEDESEEEEQGEKDHINCPCGAETSESGEEWVQCDQCDKWQHQDCVDYKDGVKYQCPACKESTTKPAPTAEPATPAVPTTALVVNTTAVVPVNTTAAVPVKPKEVYRHNLGPPIEGSTTSDGFKVAGSSDCQISFRALQPVHVKYLAQGPKHVLMVNGDQGGEVKLDKEPMRVDKEDDLAEEEEGEKGGEKDEDEEMMEGTEESQEDQIGTEDKYMFMFLVYERYMLVLRLSSEDLATPKVMYCSAISESSPVICSTVRTVGEREYSIATAHSNGEVQVQWLEVVGEGAVVPNYQYERSNYPAVQLTDKIVIPAVADAERLAWSGDRLVILKLQQVTVYSVSKEGASAVCTVGYQIPFVMDWYVTSDSVTLFDMYGQDVIIELSSQSVNVTPAKLAPPSHEVSVLSTDPDPLSSTDLNKRFRKANVCTSSEINVLRTLVSESGMLKCQVLLFKKELSYLGHLITVKLSAYVPEVPVEALKTYPNEATFLQNKFNTPLKDSGASSSSMLRSCLSGKAEELAEIEKKEKSSRRSSEVDIKPGLRKIFVDSLVGVKSIYHMKDTDIIRQILGDPDLTAVCPVCSDPLTLSLHPLLAFCQSSHRVTLDPLTFQPLDNGLECQVCGCMNEGTYCGICWAPTKAI